MTLCSMPEPPKEAAVASVQPSGVVRERVPPCPEEHHGDDADGAAGAAGAAAPAALAAAVASPVQQALATGGGR